MATEIKYGIFGLGKVVRDDDGYIELDAIIQESGLFAGIPPEELRIVELLPPDTTPQEVLDIVDKMNERTDLPFYNRKVKVKVVR